MNEVRLQNLCQHFANIASNFGDNTEYILRGHRVWINDDIGNVKHDQCEGSIGTMMEMDPTVCPTTTTTTSIYSSLVKRFKCMSFHLFANSGTGKEFHKIIYYFIYC